MRGVGSEAAFAMDLLRAGLDLLRLTPSGTQVSLLGEYVRELNRWNKRFRLVDAGFRDLVVKHVLDSLAGLEVLQQLQRKGSILDIGSGAGFPGIPLSVFLRDTDFVLLERSSKRSAFLRNCVLLLKLDNVRVIQADVEDHDGQYDVVTFRALLPFSGAVRTQRILSLGAASVAYKGRLVTILSEIATIRHLFSNIQIVELSVPFLSQERHLVVLKSADHEL